MILDFAAAPRETYTADLCIAGAGVAGICLALQFAETDLKILLLEGGGLEKNAAAQALYEGTVANPAWHPPAAQYRHRRFGGSSVAWGGRCVPYDPITFTPRPWLNDPGWPIPYEEVARYHAAAMALAEAGDADFSALTAVAGGMQEVIAGFKPASLNFDTIERFSPPTNFAARYGARLQAAGNITVLLNAHCVGLQTSADGTKVESALIKNLAGGQATVQAGRFVLAMGGLEIPRLLLNARSPAHPNGLGNNTDQVGRNYICHIAGTIGHIRFPPGTRIAHGYEQAWDGVYCRRHITLPAETQKSLQTGNVVLRLHHPRLSDSQHQTGILSLIYLAKPFISYEYAKRLHGAEKLTAISYLRHVFNVVRDPFGVAKFLLNFARVRTFAARKFPSLIVAPRANIYSLDIHAEQLPNLESRVTLTEDRDALGLQRLHIDWRYLPGDIHSVAQALAALQQELAQAGAGVLDYAPAEVEACMLRDGAFGGHHIGTTRMSSNKQDGVVDTNCQVHGVSNLFIASSAVFPNSGDANPTLTIIALALRLAAHLRTRQPAALPETAAA